MTDKNIKTEDIRYLKGVGEKRAELLCKLGVCDTGALLRFYPRAYEDWSDPDRIFFVPPGAECCVRARIDTEIRENRIRRNLILFKFNASDDTGGMQVTIFNNRYLAERLRTGQEYLFYGKMTDNAGFREMSSPMIKPVGGAGICPVYRTTAGLTSSAIEKIIKTNIDALIPENDYLDDGIRSRNGLCGLRFACKNIHFPDSRPALEQAKLRLVFDELFLLQCGLRMIAHKRQSYGATVISDHTAEFAALLPFELTNAQKRAISECMMDMSRKNSMSRLVQGDVGSGKTAVAAALMYSAAKSGKMSVMMAPTTILAAQHFETLEKLFAGTSIRIELLVGSTSAAEKTRIYGLMKSGGVDIVVGTHALFAEKAEYNGLALVVTDEQHRFGVEQRAALLKKGDHPHLLVMSATPIPRTLSLVIYGDLDVSVIDELPKGRKKIETYAVDTSLRERVYNYVKKHLDEGRQGYIICPMVEENDMDIASVKQFFSEVAGKYFDGYRVGILHGKLSPKQKDDMMARFAAGEIQLLAATSVIEVGIDVPNAVIMVIENAERFGLSQLHQLRGRIGRGQYKSTCILISDDKGDENRRRSEIICRSSDGFKIAEEDLKMRGPGDFLGKRQHGLPELMIADMMNDIEIMKTAGREAAEILKNDPELDLPQNQPLRRAVGKFMATADSVQLN